MARTPILSRRDWLRLAAVGVVGTSVSGWFDVLAADVAPYTVFSPGAYGPGFLGPKYAPLVVGDAGAQFAQGQQVDYDRALKVQDLAPPKEVSAAHADARIDLLKDMEKDFVARHPDV